MPLKTYRKYKPRIEGCCPNCQQETLAFEDQVIFIDGIHHFTSYNIPTCQSCGYDEFEIRAINHRRYRIV